VKIAWTEEKEHSHGTLGPCFISIDHPTWYIQTYRISIGLRSDEREPDWHRYEIAESDVDDLNHAKEIAVQYARDLGCRRRHRRHEYDEDLLDGIRAVVLEQLQRAIDRYDNDMAWWERQGGWATRPNLLDYGTSTSYFTGYLEQHRLGINQTRKELQRAVNVVLGRLERAGEIEAEKWDRKRYWYLAGVF
jgi:hypothetical protein